MRMGDVDADADADADADVGMRLFGTRYKAGKNTRRKLFRYPREKRA